MKFYFYIIISVFLFFSCKKGSDSTQVHTPTPYEIAIPFGFPTNLNIPEDNPMTVEGIKLGRYLFYDGRLSGRTHPDSLMSCGTCHIQENAFECGINHPKFTNGQPFGIHGDSTMHVMLPLINLVFNTNAYSWNGKVSEQNNDDRYRNIEDFVWMAVLAKHEMSGDTNRTRNLFASIPEYRQLFAEAFGDDRVSFDRISKAIAQFVRTLISANSKFDKYLRGEAQLNSDERAGFVLFTTEEGADCFHCHGGSGNPLFTTNLFYNNGKDSVFSDETADRYSITMDEMDRGAFKATTLRNIALTAPYMHDGRFKTLDEVIDFYSHHLKWSEYVNPLMHHVNNQGVQLTPKEKEELKAFIHTLRDDDFLTNPDFSEPQVFPDGFKNR